MTEVKMKDIYLDKLKDISTATGLKIFDLENTAIRKAEQYFLKDKIKSPKAQDRHYQRSIDVIERYATKKYGYCEMWAE